VASVDVRAPGRATRVTWATELEEVREFGAAEMEEGAGETADCVDDDDEEAFVDCVELLPAPDAETWAAIKSLRAVVRPGEPGQCDVASLAQARRELSAAINRATREHEQKTENLLVQLKLRYAARQALAQQAMATAGAEEPAQQATADTAEPPLATAGVAGPPQATVGAAGLLLATTGAEEPPLATAGVAEPLLATVGAEELSLATVGAAGMPLATGGVALSPSPAVVSRDAASPADDQPEEPSGTKLESLLDPPRKLKLFDRGWDSDDTKVFEKDRGKEGNTHTHTQCSLFSKVVSFLL
jgi:hypothetical protein